MYLKPQGDIIDAVVFHKFHDIGGFDFSENRTDMDGASVREIICADDGDRTFQIFCISGYEFHRVRGGQKPEIGIMISIPLDGSL